MTKLTKEYIRMLSEKWLNGTITEVEKDEYDSWYTSFKDHEIDNLDEGELFQLERKIYREIIEREQIKVEFGQRNTAPKKKNKRELFLILAASVSFFILVGSFLYYQKHAVREEPLDFAIKPGRNQAILTFEDGSVYNLDSLASGDILLDRGIRIQKTEEDELIYSLADDKKVNLNVEVFTSNIATPRGGQYKVLLPDGSVAWLNAASSLTFPSYFSEHDRVVELTGEAYFEVVEDLSRPFKVLTSREVVEVLGTSFNISSYEDELVSRTTLVQGKVKLFTTDSVQSKILMPGQQAVIVGENDIRVKQVNVQEAIAWKNGEFMFNNEDIQSVMRRIARWYDVELIYDATIDDVPIWGSISRYDDISEVLKIIELTEAAHFKIEGRRVYVMK